MLRGEVAQAVGGAGVVAADVVVLGVGEEGGRAAQGRVGQNWLLDDCKEGEMIL